METVSSAYCRIKFDGRVESSLSASEHISGSAALQNFRATLTSAGSVARQQGEFTMAKVAKTADRKKVMDTSKSTDCPKCGKPTRIVKRMKDRERGVPGGMFISCSGCDFYEKL
jgi:DNA-directed RNA polymerase subunit M/transcription elongation factor TFIIS